MEMQKGLSQAVVHRDIENMGFGGDQFLEKDYEPNSSTTPKLSLSKFPNKQKFREIMPNVMATPPSKISVSIPFQWEEAPGKPRSSSININNKTTITARRLDLPPRLLVVNNNLNTSDSSSSSSYSNFDAANFYSPTTALDGPDHGKEYSVFSLKEEFVREAKHQHHHQGRLLKSCSSWGSRSLKQEGNWPSLTSDQSFVGFPSSASFSNSKSHNTRSGGSYKLLPRFKRSSSFASLSNASSNFLAGVYGSVKQVVVQWRRRQDQTQS